MLIRAVTGMGRVDFHGQVIRKEAIQIPNHGLAGEPVERPAAVASESYTLT